MRKWYHVKIFSEMLSYMVPYAGDNLLTAVSVARDCHMIDAQDRAVLLHVSPPSGDESASIHWTTADDLNQPVTPSPQVRL